MDLITKPRWLPMGLSIIGASLLSLVPASAGAETSSATDTWEGETVGVSPILITLELDQDTFADAPATVIAEVMTETPDSAEWTISLWVNGEALPHTCSDTTMCSFEATLGLGRHGLVGVVEWGDGERAMSGAQLVQVGPEGEGESSGTGDVEASSESTTGGEPGTDSDPTTGEGSGSTAADTGGSAGTSSSTGSGTTAAVPGTSSEGAPDESSSGSCTVDPQGRAGSGWLAAVSLLLLGGWARRRRPENVEKG